ALLAINKPSDIEDTADVEAIEAPRGLTPEPIVSKVAPPANSLIFERQPEKDKDKIIAQVISPEATRDFSGQQLNSSIVHSTAEGEAKLFKSSVDNQVDKLFSSIAPADAQKVVEQITNKVPEQIAASPQAKLFKGKVDDQVEGLFSNIAPPEAQKVVQQGP